MRLHLIRHGQTDWNATRRVQGQLDSHLDESGELQARALGRGLADTPFERLYVSSSARTRETATLVFEDRVLPTVYLDELREMRLGVWEGRMWVDIEARELEQIEHYRAFSEAFSVAGAEGFGELQRRGIDAIASIVADTRRATDRRCNAMPHTSVAQQKDRQPATGRGAADATRNIAIVSHGAILRTMLAAWLDVPLPDFRHLPTMPNCAHSIVEVESRNEDESAGKVDGNHYRVVTIASEPPERGIWSARLG